MTVWSGITEDDNKKLVEGMTKACEEINIPQDTVTVIIYEVPENDLATGGRLHSRKVW